jgi:phasin family protein
MSTRREQMRNPGEALQAVSTLYVGSIQRLAELNMNTMREAVEITASATQEISRARTPQDVQYALYQPMMECAQTYSRRFYEILAQTQREFVDTMTSQLGSPTPFAAPANWGAAFDAFNSGLRRYSAMAEEGLAAAAEGSQQGASARTYGKKTA